MEADATIGRARRKAELIPGLVGPLRLGRAGADADGLARELIAGWRGKKRDEVCDFFGFDHFSERNPGHGFLPECFDRDSLRSRDVTHARASHFRIRPARTNRIDGDLPRRKLER